VQRGSDWNLSATARWVRPAAMLILTS